MEPDKRFNIFVAAVILVAFAIELFNLPDFFMNIVVDVGISFVVSGVFYIFLVGMGLDFLEDINISFISLMTVAVFISKNLLI